MVKIYNPYGYEKLVRENHEEFNLFNNHMENDLGYRFNYNVLKEIAVHLLLKTHDDLEVLEVIQMMQQLKR